MKDIYFSDQPGVQPEKPNMPKKNKKNDDEMQDIYSKNKKSKLKIIGMSFIVFFSILAVLLIIAFALLHSMFNGINYKPGENIDNPYISDNDLLKDGQIKNILLLGSDARPGEKSSRADTMMLVSIDTKNKKIKLTSFLRDTYVQIPGHEKTRLNAAFSYGQVPLTINTIEYIYKIKIDDYVLVNFETFTKVVDAVGGIDVPISQKESRALWNDFPELGKIKSGNSVHLSGEQALAFSRIRHVDSDFFRTSRQRIVIKAVVDKSKTMEKAKMLKLVQEIMPLVQTDISPTDMSTLAVKGLLSYLHYEVLSLGLPIEGAYTSQTINGQSVLVPDLAKNCKILQDYIYNNNYIPETETNK